MQTIIDGCRGSAFNMAADRHLLIRCIADESVYVRFYQWTPPAVSLGHMQAPEQILDLEVLQRDGVEWVKRPTGGRAVLHHDDLTYSCVFPSSCTAMGTSVAESYRVISRCLLLGFELAGIAAQSHDSGMDTAEARREIKLPCFLAPNREEIMVDGRKLVGSAQKRTSGAVLQHGSIPITNAYRRLPRYLRVDEQQRRTQEELLGRKTVCLHEILPDFGIPLLIEHLTRGFAEVLQRQPAQYEWSAGDLREIASVSQQRT